MDFLKTVAASHMKIARSRQLIEIMKVCEYSRSFLDLGPRSFIYEN